MTRSTITTVFLTSLLGGVAGLVMLGVTGVLAYRYDVFEMDGPDVVGVTSSSSSWTMLILAITALVVLLAAAVGQLVAWIGALLSTAQLDDKAWFVVLLVTGILGVGFVAMVVYLLIGPDDRQAAHQQVSVTPEAMATSGRT